MIFYIFLTIILIIIDQVAKLLARLYLTSSSYVEVIPNFIHLTYQENKGISFSFLSNLPESIRVPVLVGVTTLVVIGFIIYTYKNWERFAVLEKVGYSFIISGAIGNLIDRAFRQQVTDYMHFHVFDFGLFVNNFADDLVAVGFALVLIQMIIISGKQKK